MISVDEALGHIFSLVSPLGAEDVPLAHAGGRTLARTVHAARAQPPFATSVMDGYAVRSADVAPGARLRVIGAARAGLGSQAHPGPGEALRIFTGAPVPPGADRVLIQEDVTRDGDHIVIGDEADAGPYIRPAGADFRPGDPIEAPRLVDPSVIVLAAAMNHATLPCSRKPRVAIISTGDELVPPGGTPGPDQIIASNGLGLKALIDGAGGQGLLLPIARDRPETLHAVFDLARGADLVVTIGGASVGDHDHVRAVAAQRGMTPAFYKVAMRPGKPLMAGMMGDTPMIGLPGNPVSAMVCGTVFVLPALRVLLGHPPAPTPRLRAPLARAVPANGPREHYMRASLSGDGLTVFDRQDSGLMGLLARADALVVRPPHDPARDAGMWLEYISL